jgi:hypothetical protein
MKWEKTGTDKKGRGKYSASCDGEKTTFNFNGMVLTRDFTSQEDAVKFLIVNNFVPFDIDGSSKSGEEVEIPEKKIAKSVYDLKEEIVNDTEEDLDDEDLDEDDWEDEDDS